MYAERGATLRVQDLDSKEVDLLGTVDRYTGLCCLVVAPFSDGCASLGCS